MDAMCTVFAATSPASVTSRASFWIVLAGAVASALALVLASRRAGERAGSFAATLSIAVVLAAGAFGALGALVGMRSARAAQSHATNALPVLAPAAMHSNPSPPASADKPRLHSSERAGTKSRAARSEEGGSIDLRKAIEEEDLHCINAPFRI